MDFQGIVKYTGLRYSVRVNDWYHRIFGDAPADERRRVLAELEALRANLTRLEDDLVEVRIEPALMLEGEIKVAFTNTFSPFSIVNVGPQVTVKLTRRNRDQKRRMAAAKRQRRKRIKAILERLADADAVGFETSADCEEGGDCVFELS